MNSGKGSSVEQVIYDVIFRFKKEISSGEDDFIREEVRVKGNVSHMSTTSEAIVNWRASKTRKYSCRG